MNERVIHNWLHPTGKLPKEVVFLGLGETKRQYADIHAVNHGPVFPVHTEVWTLNNGLFIWPHDCLFVMDDLQGEAHKWPAYGNALKGHHHPIITSTRYPEYRSSMAYPFEEVCRHFALTGLSRYFFNSLPYIIAYACFIGVERLTLLGCDYTHPASPGPREEDQANTEWWLGFVTAKGMKITLANDTTLMRARETGRPLYGYRFDPRLTMDRQAPDNQAETGPPPPKPGPRRTAIREAIEAVERNDAGPSQPL